MASAPTIVIGFSGSATIRNVEDNAKRLTQALSQSDRVEVDFSQLEEVDFTFVQLMVSALKTAEAEGKTLAASMPARGPLLDVLKICGLESSPRRKFWLQDEVA